ncbi:MAG TPA: hypothetical protein PK208_13515 [Fibrobacteria bacterium]|nr:hypothetical protein [Fibrobacteria bacterium]
MSSKQTKTADKKPKGAHPSDLRQADAGTEPRWNGKRLPATFEWDFPARLLPTRRDEVSERWSDRMDMALVDAIRASYAQPGPGAPSEAMLHAQREYHGPTDNSCTTTSRPIPSTFRAVGAVPAAATTS